MSTQPITEKDITDIQIKIVKFDADRCSVVLKTWCPKCKKSIDEYDELSFDLWDFTSLAYPSNSSNGLSSNEITQEHVLEHLKVMCTQVLLSRVMQENPNANTEMLGSLLVPDRVFNITIPPEPVTDVSIIDS
jgi:hypothetical protein